jgi:hypothetical protein
MSLKKTFSNATYESDVHRVYAATVGLSNDLTEVFMSGGFFSIAHVYASLPALTGATLALSVNSVPVVSVPATGEIDMVVRERLADLDPFDIVTVSVTGATAGTGAGYLSVVLLNRYV